MNSFSKRWSSSTESGARSGGGTAPGALRLPLDLYGRQHGSCAGIQVMMSVRASCDLVDDCSIGYADLLG